MMAADTSTKACLNDIEVHKTESVASASSSSSSASSLSTASGKALLALSKTELDQLIAENMTSVLKALKKRKHAKKHARLRQAAAAPEQAIHEESTKKEESNRSSVQTEEEMDRKEKKESHNRKGGKSRSKKEEKNSAHDTSESKSKLPQASLKEVQRGMKAESTEGATPPHTNGISNGQPMEKTGKENKTVNAFQLMMKARSKCIGSNSPGKERDVRELSPTQELAREKKAARNLQLQQWAAQKGAGKRKIQEEAEEDYIEHQMKKRTKRLKKLINNMNGGESSEKESPVLKEKEVVDVLVIPDSPVRPKVEPQKESNRKSSPKETCTENTPKTNGEIKVSSGRKGRGRPRKNVVVETNEQEKAKAASDDEFLVQLSSPRKKKDSLLGYFAKLTPENKKPQHDSPPAEKVSKTPSSSNTAMVETVLIDDENSKEMETASTPPSQVSSSRPRRSCANRIKDYSAFEQYSPAKEEQKPTASKKPPIVTPLKIINVQSPNAMKVVKSPSLRMFSSAGAEDTRKLNATNEWPSTPKSVKLAPVFARTMGGKIQPPQEDPEKVRARQLFLMSGIPDKMRQEREKRAIYEDYVLNESPVFPLVSHVMQMEDNPFPSTPTKINFSKSCIKLRSIEVESSPEKKTPKSGKGSKIRFGTFTSCSECDFEEALEKCNQPIVIDGGNGVQEELPEVENVKEIVRDYKQRFPHFPVFRCYKQFRAIYQDHLQQTEHEEKQPLDGANSNGTCRPQDESFEIIEPKFSCRNGEALFTEKYKPQNTEQILINFSPANMLTQFLSLWIDEPGGQKRPNEGSSQSGHYFMSTEKDDDMDFLLANDSNSSSANGPGSNVCNHVVLVGPPGCGKTSNVYAVANEMNFNVLEINASSRRKGKIILQELLEATQSHQVRQKSERSNSVDGLLINGRQKGSGRGKNGLSGVFRCLERRPSFSETPGNGTKKLSLILIEDADIVFEQDDGFLAAINQLIATSKRPIVLTTTNPSCTHMARYMARNNVIRYVAPGIGNVSKFLSVLALVERIPIEQHDLGRLYAYNGKDMRKTLNELQFFIQSGGDMERFPSTNERGDLCATDSEEYDTGLNETREEEDDGEQGTPEDGACYSSAKKFGRKKDKNALVKHYPHHGTLYELFTRNQNESILLRIPLDFNVLWCNMELVLRTAQMFATRNVQSGGEKGKRNSSAGKQRSGKRASIVRKEVVQAPEVSVCEELAWLYENISHAEAGWGVTERNRIRYGKDVQDEQQQQQLANELGHALVEGSWIEWFSRGETKGVRKRTGGEKAIGAKAYDALRKLEQEPRQTISSYIGVNGIRSRVTACDYEPLLRQICRYERDRFLTERRGSRFYHYLRNFATANGVTQQVISTTSTQMTSTTMVGLTGLKPAGGFSVDHFDALSHCFEEQQQPTDAETD